MANWVPISGSALQFSKNAGGAAAADYYLKFYAAGTTTAISMATTSSGVTTLDKCKIDATGWAVNGSDDPFIPHIDRDYKLVLYTNAADADNDATGSAAWVIDNLSQEGVEKTYTSVTALRDSTGNDSFNVIEVESYHEITYPSTAGPKGGHRRHRTGGTNTSPTVGSPVAVSTIGTGTQAGYVWDADGVEWFISEQPLNVDMFGAKGDGVTDDTSSLQSAFDYLDTFNSSVSLRPKISFTKAAKYITSDELTCTRTAHIDGQGATIQSTVNDASKSVLVCGDTGTSTYMWKIDDLTIAYASGTSLSSGLTLERFNQGELRKVYINGFTKQLVFSNTSGDPFIGWLTVDKCYLQGGDYAIYATGVPANVVSITDNRFLQNSVSAISLDAGTNVTIAENDFSFCTQAIDISNGNSLSIYKNYTESCGPGTENNTSTLIGLTACASVDIYDNNLNGVNGSWRDREHMYLGVSCASCDHVSIRDNYFTYFQEAAIRFDANCGDGNSETRNKFTENFSPNLGVKVSDLSGKLETDFGLLPPLGGDVRPVMENYCTAPREIANNWTHGAHVTAGRNLAGTTPYFDDTGLADRITYNSGGADKNSNIITSNVTGGAGEKFELRFWAYLNSVVNTSPLSGTGVLKVRVLDGATVLTTQYVTPSKLWKLFTIEVTDTNATPHGVTLDFAPADATYMEFSWSVIGVQYCRQAAPYIYDRYSASSSYSIETSASQEVYPKVSKQEEFAIVQQWGTAAPTTGTWRQGDRVWDRTPSASGHIGWVCVTAGTPGTWKTFGTISA